MLYGHADLTTQVRNWLLEIKLTLSIFMILTHQL